MDFDYSSGYSPRVCRRCKHLRRKCDKALPKCASCAKSRFKCIYQDHQESYARHGPLSSVTSSGALSERVLRPPALGTEGSISGVLSPIYFLDFQLYQSSIADIPRITTAIPPDLQALTADIRESARLYFLRIHPWIPFLSKKLFNERLLSPLTPQSIDITLLFACIGLVSKVPEGENPRSKAYLIIKSALLEAEVAGVLTIRVFQAWILLCVYELGHGIYPSAYVSIGACAKYGAALGLTSQTYGPEQSSNWIEAEEKTRSWWAIIILDRFANLGCPTRSLSTEDLANDTRLPIDDVSWDQAVRKDSHDSTLSTPISPRMGRFGLMAQAASLLGRVFHHLSNSKDDVAFSSEEAIILERALVALTTVAKEEGRSRGIGICTPVILCLSARIALALHSPKQGHSMEGLGCDSESHIINGGVGEYMIQLCQWSTSELKQQLDGELSPFPMNAAYYTGAAYLNLYYKGNNSKYLERISEIKTLLTLCSQRWKVSEVYLRMIEARESIHINSL